MQMNNLDSSSWRLILQVVICVFVHDFPSRVFSSVLQTYRRHDRHTVCTGEPFETLSSSLPLEAIFLSVLSKTLPDGQIKENCVHLLETAGLINWALLPLALCLAPRQDQASRWLLRGLCVTLVLTLHSQRSAESNTAGSCCLNLHATADKAAPWVRSGHRILRGLSLCAESVFGCRWSDRRVVEERQWCHQNTRQGEGNASV